MFHKCMLKNKAPEAGHYIAVVVNFEICYQLKTLIYLATVTLLLKSAVENPKLINTSVIL